MDLAEEPQDLGEDLRFGVDLQAARPGAPGLVTAELVPRGGRDVPVVAIGQLDGERRLERALLLDGDARLGEDLAGDRGDPEPADPQGLELELGLTRSFAQEYGLPRVNLAEAIQTPATG